MSDDTSTVTVTILEKDYQVSCPEDEVEALTASARFLDKHMAEIRASGKVVGLDRIAVIAGLNITNDFLKSETNLTTTQSTAEGRVQRLNDRVGRALAEHKQLDL
jgi:cell division protein ZapA